MARTSVAISSRSDDTPELSELIGPFLKVSELEGQMTPYKVVVLVLLEQYTTYDPIDDFSVAEKRRIALGFLSLFRSASRPFSDLKRVVCADFDSAIMANIFHLLSKRAREMELDLFVSMFYGCIARIVYGDAKSSIKSTSLAGQFVRKLFISYKKASFVDLCRLWTDFCGYFSHDSPPSSDQDLLLPSSRRAKDIPDFLSFSDSNNDVSMESIHGTDISMPVRARRTEKGDSFIQSLSVSRNVSSSTNTYVPSQKEALGFIVKQVHLLENDSASALSYNATARWINDTRKQLPFFHELYFLEYLNELRVKNLAAAESALHRYVDCAGLSLMNRNIFDAGSSSSRLTAPATSGIPMSAFRSLRYGPLLLADMHRRFGNEDNALAYLQECIKNAEEANDKICLDYAVALFAMLACAKRRMDYHRIIDQALKDTEDRNAAALHFRCHLSQLLKNIGDCRNAKNLIETKHLIFSEVLEKVPIIGGKDRSWTERSVKNAVRVAFSSMYLQRGYYNAACLEAQKILYSTTIVTSDITSIAVTNFAYAMAAKGQYAKAKAIMADYKPRFAKFCKEYDRLCLADALIGFEMAFLAGDNDECKRNLAVAETFSQTEARYRRAIYYAARDAYNESIDAMTQLLRSDEGRDPYTKCRALLLLGRLFLHRASKVGIAQEYLMQCLATSQEFRFPHLATMSSCELMEAKAILDNGANGRSADDNMPPGEETWFLSVVDTACVNLSTARVMLKQCSSDPKGAAKCITLLESISNQLDSINGKLYQRQAYALLATAHQYAGKTEARNRMSKLYRQLHENLRNAGFTTLIF